MKALPLPTTLQQSLRVMGRGRGRESGKDQKGTRMNIYHIFCTLKDGASDLAFARALANWLEHLKAKGMIENWRLMRRKLGLGPDDLGEFHIMIETVSLAALDEAFSLAASRTGEAETLHYEVTRNIKSVKFALYRDFPDTIRKTGEELF
jgi:hypothetical protein